jgi:hypothetical protein
MFRRSGESFLFTHVTREITILGKKMSGYRIGEDAGGWVARTYHDRSPCNGFGKDESNEIRDFRFRNFVKRVGLKMIGGILPNVGYYDWDQSAVWFLTDASLEEIQRCLVAHKHDPNDRDWNVLKHMHFWIHKSLKECKRPCIEISG